MDSDKGHPVDKIPRRENYQQYEPSHLEEALKMKRKGFNYLEIFLKTGVPKSTLYRRFNNANVGVEVAAIGRKPALDLDESEALYLTIVYLIKNGHPLTKEDFIAVASNIAKRQLGDRWYDGFITSHPDLTLRTPTNKPIHRHHDDADDIIKLWFELLRKHLPPNLPPRNCWNIDETSLMIALGKQKVLGLMGENYAVQNSPTIDEKEARTILVGGNCEGDRLPVLVIYAAVGLYLSWVSGGSNNVVYTTSQSGWIVSEIFYWYCQKALFPKVIELSDPSHPIVIFWDGHVSHLSVKLVQLAMKSNIQLLCYPPGFTDVIQPLDIAVFRPLKVAWGSVVRHFGRLGQKPNQKSVFPKMLKMLFENKRVLTKEQLINGFKASGISFENGVLCLNEQDVLKRLPGKEPKKFSQPTVSRAASFSSRALCEQPCSSSQAPPQPISLAPPQPISLAPPQVISLATPQVISQASSFNDQHVIEKLVVKELIVESIVAQNLSVRQPIFKSPQTKAKEAVYKILHPENEQQNFGDEHLKLAARGRAVPRACGEVLTSEECLQRLQQQEDERKKKEEDKIARKQARQAATEAKNKARMTAADNRKKAAIARKNARIAATEAKKKERIAAAAAKRAAVMNQKAITQNEQLSLAQNGSQLNNNNYTAQVDLDQLPDMIPGFIAPPSIAELHGTPNFADILAPTFSPPVFSQYFTGNYFASSSSPLIMNNVNSASLSLMSAFDPIAPSCPVQVALNQHINETFVSSTSSMTILQPMDTSSTLQQQMASFQPVVTAKRRGRPPGSRNKPKTA